MIADEVLAIDEGLSPCGMGTTTESNVVLRLWRLTESETPFGIARRTVTREWNVARRGCTATPSGPPAV
jgi:hypothetical protein